MRINLKHALAAVFCLIIMTTAGLCQSRSLERETAACQGDATRLCGPYIPDHAKIHACLLAYKAYLSPACHAMVAPSHHHHHRKPT